MAEKKSRRQRLTEQSIVNELQKEAEKMMGKMEDVRNETSLGFMVKFYIDQMPKKPETERERVKMAMCITLCTRILAKANATHGISDDNFIAMTKA